VELREFRAVKRDCGDAVLGFLSEDGKNCSVFEEDFVLVDLVFQVQGWERAFDGPMIAGGFPTKLTRRIFSELCEKTRMPCIIVAMRGNRWEPDEEYYGGRHV
jgi:hypothetical protein